MNRLLTYMKQRALAYLMDAPAAPELRQLGQMAAKEINIIHDRFAQLGVRAAVNVGEVIASDTANFIRYPLIATGKIASIESIEQDLSVAISMHRGIETTVSVRSPMLALELPYPMTTRPLLWSDANLGALQPGQALLGMDYTAEIPKPALLDFYKRHIGHCLVAGASGSGKTVELINLVVSLCHSTSPADLQIVFVDSKFDEDWAALPGLPHVTMVNEPTECAAAIASVRAELERRKRQPDTRKVILIIDEFADLIGALGNEGDTVNADVRAITNVGRSKNVHVILCTQKPVAELLDTVGKANCTSRVCLQVMTQKESEIGMGRGGIGCEDLPGLGAFNAILGGGRVIRGQSYLLEGDALAEAIDLVNAKYANAEPYRITLIEPADQPSSATVAINLDELNAERILEVYRPEQLFDDAGNIRKGMQLAAVKVLFGDGATNAGQWHRTTVAALALIKKSATTTTETDTTTSTYHE